jgi:hypothetical protein
MVETKSNAFARLHLVYIFCQVLPLNHSLSVFREFDILLLGQAYGEASDTANRDELRPYRMIDGFADEFCVTFREMSVQMEIGKRRTAKCEQLSGRITEFCTCIREICACWSVSRVIPKINKDGIKHAGGTRSQLQKLLHREAMADHGCID